MRLIPSCAPVPDEPLLATDDSPRCGGVFARPSPVIHCGSTFPAALHLSRVCDFHHHHKHHKKYATTTKNLRLCESAHGHAKCQQCPEDESIASRLINHVNDRYPSFQRPAVRASVLSWTNFSLSSIHKVSQEASALCTPAAGVAAIFHTFSKVRDMNCGRGMDRRSCETFPTENASSTHQVR